jgi:hypothetical protein
VARRKLVEPKDAGLVRLALDRLEALRVARAPDLDTDPRRSTTV